MIINTRQQNHIKPKGRISFSEPNIIIPENLKTKENPKSKFGVENLISVTRTLREELFANINDNFVLNALGRSASQQLSKANSEGLRVKDISPIAISNSIKAASQELENSARVYFNSIAQNNNLTNLAQLPISSSMEFVEFVTEQESNSEIEFPIDSKEVLAFAINDLRYLQYQISRQIDFNIEAKQISPLESIERKITSILELKAKLEKTGDTSNVASQITLAEFYANKLIDNTPATDEFKERVKSFFVLTEQLKLLTKEITQKKSELAKNPEQAIIEKLSNLEERLKNVKDGVINKGFEYIRRDFLNKFRPLTISIEENLANFESDGTLTALRERLEKIKNEIEDASLEFPISKKTT